MKCLKHFFIASNLVLVFSACKVADKKDYANMAKDVCGCVTKHTNNISDGMKLLIINSEGDTSKFNEGLIKYMTNNEPQAVSDVLAMTSFGNDFEKCMLSLEKKYNNIYTEDSDREIQNKLKESLKKTKLS